MKHLTKYIYLVIGFLLKLLGKLDIIFILRTS